MSVESVGLFKVNDYVRCNSYGIEIGLSRNLSGKILSFYDVNNSGEEYVKLLLDDHCKSQYPYLYIKYLELIKPRKSGFAKFIQKYESK